MKEFNFKTKDARALTLKINGRNYTFNPESYNAKKATEKFVNVNKVIVANLKKESKKEIADQKVLDGIALQSCTLVKETIDKILGKNSYDKIFSGRAIDFYENQELMTFIFEEITKFRRRNKKMSVPN